MLKAVLFDFDGTLVDFVGTDIRCLKQVHERSGADCTPDEFTDSAVEEIMAFHSLVDKGQVDPLQMHRVRLENTLNRYGIEWDHKYLILYQKKLFEQARPFPGVKNLLSGLRRQGLKLGLITNAYDGEEQRRRLACSDLTPFFDEIVISGEVGLAKPCPEIFHFTLEKLGVAAVEAAFVGDIEKYDIQGANAAGMTSILICKKRSYRSASADHTCHSFKGLHQLFDRIIT